MNPVCSCHGVPKTGNGGGKVICRVRKLERERARYHSDMATPEGKAKRNAKSRRQAEKRRSDPAYQLDKQLWELTRIRVRY